MGAAGLPELLRGHRLAAGLTQVELAGRAGVGVRTVRDLERGRSSRPQRTTVELLAEALGLSGPARTAFLAAARGPRGGATRAGDDVAVALGRGGRTPLPTAATAGAGPDDRLPPPIELIGRDDDIAELAGLLRRRHLHPAPVSLVGLAGVGKTALALSVAAATDLRHRAGVVISEGADADDVLTAVATVFGVAQPGEMSARLADDPALLVVDAVERAPDAVATALAWLAGALPGLRVLATGRHPVGLPGERVWPVTPLEVPPVDGPVELGELARFPAVALFLARLDQVRREPPGADELPALRTLVHRLGGLPLAIELVAARGRVLDLNEMLDRYGDRVLGLGAPAAPRSAVAVTLRDAVAASYHLLAPLERRALRRLSVFRNRWSVEVAEELLVDRVDEGEVDPVPLLDRLLELGLLAVRGSGEFRFRLVDVVRDFAAEEAAASGEATAIRRRHATVLSRYVARLTDDVTDTGPGSAVRRLDEMSADLAAALAHAANDDPETALRLATGLCGWWRLRRRNAYGRQWLRRLLDDPRTADADPVLRSRAALAMAGLATDDATVAGSPDRAPAWREQRSPL